MHGAPARASVSFSDGTTLATPLDNGAFLIAHAAVARACTVQVFNREGAIIEQAPVNYSDSDGNWSTSPPCP